MRLENLAMLDWNVVIVTKDIFVIVPDSARSTFAGVLTPRMDSIVLLV